MCIQAPRSQDNFVPPTQQGRFNSSFTKVSYFFLWYETEFQNLTFQVLSIY